MAQPPKAALRGRARQRRAALGAEFRAEASRRVGDLVAAALPDTGPVLSYAAMGDELDLAPLNHVLAAAGRLHLPRVEGRDLAAVAAPPGGELVRSPFGVLEPAGDAIDPVELLAVVVPALVYDSRGFRIGYGAGFYDRFLPRLDPACVVIGVCFSAQIVPDVGPESHDVAVQRVLSELG